MELATRQNQTAVSMQESDRAITEAAGAIQLAKRFPRDQDRAEAAIMRACQRTELAEKAMYSYARGGQEVTGPSIRLAECLAQHWGNIQTGVKELERTATGSVMEAFAWDMESNLRVSKAFHVQHERYSSKGSKKLSDPRDIYELTANDASRRQRACILAVIPGEVVEAAVNACRKTLATKGDNSAEGVRLLVEGFAEFGVTVAQIEKKIQRNLSAVQPAQLVSLRNVLNSLRDGMSQPGAWFDGAAMDKWSDDEADYFIAQCADAGIDFDKLCRWLPTIKSSHPSIKTPKQRDAMLESLKGDGKTAQEFRAFEAPNDQ